MKFVHIFILLCVMRTSFQKSTPTDDSYVAAAVEYEYTSNTTTNLQNYLHYIAKAAEQNADIVVFPEMTLTRRHPVKVPMFGAIKEHPVPANSPALYDEVLVTLSASAIEHQLYVVVNLEERVDCVSDTDGELCPDNKTYLFNTNVVFDRNGAIIDRYRKINLFGEFSRTPAITPDLGVFTTDFGVTFGHFICFDLMFQVPAVQVVEKLNITDVIFTTMWFSEMPFLTAVQIQEAYARATNVNFIASGANNVRVGSAGSGIYSGKAGALISTMPGAPTSRLLVARVPKVPGKVSGVYPGPIVDPPSDADGFLMKQDQSVKAHATRLLTPGFQDFVLTQNEVSCRFRVKMSQRNGDKGVTFRALAHDGTNTYVRRQIGTVSCAIVACQTHSIDSCPFRYNSTDYAIEELSVEMMTTRIPYNTTLHCDNAVYFASTLQTNNFPLAPKNYTFTELTQNGRQQNGGRMLATIKLNEAQNGIISFGIWGRVFTRDVNHNTVVSEKDVKDSEEVENTIFNALSVGDSEHHEHYEYHATVFDGVRTFDGLASGGSRVCSVLACTSSDASTCGLRFDAYVENTTAIFEELSIEASVPTPKIDAHLSTKDSVYFPVSVDIHTLPLRPEDFTYSEESISEKTMFKMSLTNTTVEIYSFAVWGRRFATDGEEPTPAIGSSGSHSLSFWLATVTTILFMMSVCK